MKPSRELEEVKLRRGSLSGGSRSATACRSWSQSSGTAKPCKSTSPTARPEALDGGRLEARTAVYRLAAELLLKVGVLRRSRLRDVEYLSPNVVPDRESSNSRYPVSVARSRFRYQVTVPTFLPPSLRSCLASCEGWKHPRAAVRAVPAGAHPPAWHRLQRDQVLIEPAVARARCRWREAGHVREYCTLRGPCTTLSSHRIATPSVRCRCGHCCTARFGQATQSCTPVYERPKTQVLKRDSQYLQRSTPRLALPRGRPPASHAARTRACSARNPRSRKRSTRRRCSGAPRSGARASASACLPQLV